MASQLREVLNQFEAQHEPVSVRAMAHQMNLNPNVLQGMIDYWVRKGKLRIASSGGESCHTCGIKGACPFVVNLPHYYERVQDDGQETHLPCTCGDTCTS